MKLTTNQQKAISHTYGNCKVMSTAGSGKTTTLVERCRRLYKEFPDHNQLCLTFSKSAAQNMSHRAGLPPAQVKFSTFHALCWGILKAYQPDQADSNKLLSGKESWMIDQWADKVADTIGKQHISAAEVNQAYILAAASGFMPEEWVSNRVAGSSDDAHAAFLLHQAISQAGRITFSDMQMNALRLLRSNPEIVTELQNTYAFISVDEFQDTTGIQLELLKVLTKGNNLFVVGDVDQTIVSFAGANPQLMVDFAKHFGEHEIISLDTNFRCQQEVVKVADQLIQFNLVRDKKEVFAHHAAGTPPKVYSFLSEEEESGWVISQVKSLLAKGVPATDIAIMYRTNAYAGGFEADLVMSDIPFQNADSSEGFFGMLEPKTVLSYLRAVVDPSDLASLRYIWNKPNRFLANKLLNDAVKSECTTTAQVLQHILTAPTTKSYLKPKIQELRARLSNIYQSLHKSPETVLADIYRDCRIGPYLQERSNLPSGRDLETATEILRRLIRNVAARCTSCKQLLSYVDRAILESQKKGKVAEGVWLTTIHKAKGLEYPYVFVVGASDNRMPHEKSNNIEEERRIMFVALTRAQKELTITCAGEPSRFIQEMGLTTTTTETTNDNQDFQY